MRYNFFKLFQRVSHFFLIALLIFEKCLCLFLMMISSVTDKLLAVKSYLVQD